MDNLKIKEKKTKQSILTDLFFFFISPTLSAILLASCFNPKIPSSFCWISLIPLIASGDFYKQSPVKRFGCGFFFGIIFFALSFWWIGLVTVIGTVALIAYLALYPAIWLLAISPPFVNYQSTSAKDNLINALVIANLWIISEWFRSWLFSGFPWNELGSSAYKNILLIQLCSLGGVFLLSWFIAFINALLYFMVRSVFSHFTTKLLYLPKIEALTAILLFGLGFFYGEQRLIKDSAEDKALKIRFAAIQPNIPQDLYIPVDPEEAFLEEITLSRQTLSFKPDLVCWPESPFGIDFFASPKLLEPIHKLQEAHPFSFLAGSFKASATELFNVAVLYKSAGEDPQVYAKNHLVPFGEYTPFAHIFPFLRKLVPFQIDLSPGTEHNLFFLDRPQLKIAPLICFEDTLASYVREMTAQNPDLLIDITNDGWFKDSPGAFLHMINALFRTVELDIPMLRCTNTGISVWIDQRGRITQMLTQKEGKAVDCKGILLGEAYWHHPVATPYQKLGDWIVLLAFTSLGLLLVPPFSHKKIIKKN
ncbi:apolipoprotein N-acyltransferase [Methylacidiphilum caldifontis]|uniref:apolipoprotein N-acyltransferase n=1 Tax=Methylacidiphilum caldifontis TaxID=2795386 RepID=UPI001A8C8293|nr:apolipoprotein N-acyltransferase [Methylacidiphilum caldifontis]QSR88518.1 apolipoprotein N-acyltransferase [Methylacidiphilum caldifontis]